MQQLLHWVSRLKMCKIIKPFNFLRTHQSHLVNIQFVKSHLNEDGGKLLMKDATKIPISRQNKVIVKSVLNELA